MARENELTPDQKAELAKRCPANAEGTIKNAAELYRSSSGVGAFIIGGGFFAASLGTPTGILAGLPVGFLAAEVGEWYGKREGSKLAATGVLQQDKNCVREVTNAFEALNRFKPKADTMPARSQ